MGAGHLCESDRTASRSHDPSRRPEVHDRAAPPDRSPAAGAGQGPGSRGRIPPGREGCEPRPAAGPSGTGLVAGSDPVGDGDHRVASRDDRALERRDAPGPARLRYGTPSRLVGVVDEPRPHRPGAEPAGASIAASCAWTVSGRRRVGRGRMRPGTRPARRCRAAATAPRAAASRIVTRTPSSSPSSSPRTRGRCSTVTSCPSSASARPAPPDPRVVLHRLVEQHRNPHQPADPVRSRATYPAASSESGSIARTILAILAASPISPIATSSLAARSGPYA